MNFSAFHSPRIIGHFRFRNSEDNSSVENIAPFRFISVSMLLYVAPLGLGLYASFANLNKATERKYEEASCPVDGVHNALNFIGIPLKHCAQFRRMLLTSTPSFALMSSASPRAAHAPFSPGVLCSCWAQLCQFCVDSVFSLRRWGSWSENKFDHPHPPY